jgi:hypothetical protein
MATQTLTLRTSAIGTLTALQFSGNMAAADVASIDQGISNDQAIVSTSKGPAGTAIQGAVIFGGASVSGTAAITGFSLASPASATIASITAGQYVYGLGIAPGTQVLNVGALSTINLTKSPTITQASTYFIAAGSSIPGAFSSYGWLNVPNRGCLKLLPGDVVATGPAGEVIVVPQTALPTVFPGSLWVLT